ncbi:MAG TPA: protein phosphatase 2C domain-containing protein [Actinocrinis sp.]|nr:protein phosphatase 2C domain-containing protein [Actinocrinis sp.]
MITLRSGAASDVGRVRTSNEDSVFAGARVFVVADGMGGHAAGEVASALAVERLARLDDHDGLRPEDIRRELTQANEDILAAARQDAARGGMGSTVAGLALATVAGSTHWVVFHAGDSRVYRLNPHALVQLTADHTEAAELVANGVICADQAATHPSRHIVTRALGSYPAPEPDLLMLPPSPGDVFLLCSDGLTRELDEPEIADVMRAMASPGQAAAALVGRAVERGGRDNVSAVVVEQVHDGAGAAEDRTIPRATAVTAP